MKQEKDTRINVNYVSILKERALLFLFLGGVNAIHLRIILSFFEHNVFEINMRFATRFLVGYLFIVSLLATFILGFIRFKSWIKPLKKLSEAARLIANGDLSIRIDPRRKDGKKDFVELLFDDFNTMVEQLACANDKLKALSTTDELTRLNNRRSFLEYMEIIWKQNHRLNLPVTVLMIDIDYFKKYNDSLGHLEGDKVLIAIAQCMKNHIKRETDFIARFGGEEFVCVLPFVKKDEAANFAKTLVESVENMKIPHPMSEYSKYVTISAGMASIVPNDNNSPAQLLDEADKALYTAKESGRNRIVVH